MLSTRRRAKSWSAVVAAVVEEDAAAGADVAASAPAVAAIAELELDPELFRALCFEDGRRGSAVMELLLS